MVFWVFGYGSLVWNPGFEFDEKIKGFIKNYKRVFDLGKPLLLIAKEPLHPFQNSFNLYTCLHTTVHC